MRSFLCVSGYALVVAGLCLAAAAPANAGGCSKLVGTADGWDKSDALSGSQAALAGAVNDFKKGKRADHRDRHAGEPSALLAGVRIGRSLR